MNGVNNSYYNGYTNNALKDLACYQSQTDPVLKETVSNELPEFEWMSWTSEETVKQHAAVFLGNGKYMFPIEIKLTEREYVLFDFSKDVLCKYIVIINNERAFRGVNKTNTLIEREIESVLKNYKEMQQVKQGYPLQCPFHGGCRYDACLIYYIPSEEIAKSYFTSDILNKIYKDEYNFPPYIEFLVENRISKIIFEAYLSTLNQEEVKKIFFEGLKTFEEDINFTRFNTIDPKYYKYYSIKSWRLPLLIPHIKIESQDDAKQMIRFAAAIGDMRLIKECLRFDPIRETREAQEAIFEAIQNLQVDAVRLLKGHIEVESYKPQSKFGCVFGHRRMLIEEHIPFRKLLKRLFERSYLEDSCCNVKKMITPDIDTYIKLCWELIPDYEVLKDMQIEIKGWEPKNLLDILFEFKKLNGNRVDPLIIHCIEQGTAISKEFQHTLLIEWENLSKELKDVVRQHNLLPSVQKSASDFEALMGKIYAEHRVHEMIAEMERLNDLLNQNFSKTKNNSFLLDTESVRQCWIIKKFIKRYFAENERFEGREDLERALKTLTQAEKKLIAVHHVLMHLMQMNREVKGIRRGKSFILSPVLSKFFYLWNSHSIHKEESVLTILKILKNPTEFWNMKMRFMEAYREVCEHPRLATEGTAYIGHGTSHSTLVAMKSQREPKLLALGDLWKVDVPLCGELCGSDTSINKRRISAVPLEPFFEYGEKRDVTRYMDAPTYVLVNYFYATQEKKYTEHFKEFNPEDAIKRLNAFLEVSIEDYKALPVTILKVDILRLRKTQSMPEELLAKLKIKIEDVKRSEFSSVCDEFQQAFDFEVIPFNEKQLRQIKNAFPIVLATFGQKKRLLYNNSETLLNSGLRLGEEIKMIFTFPENKHRLGKILKDSPGIEILDFDVLFALETVSMCLGSRTRRAYYLDEIGLETSPKEQLKKMDQILMEEVFPHYSYPFPASPTYKVPESQTEGFYKRTVKIDNPLFTCSQKSHEDYLKEFQLGERPAREIHGTMHASRAALWSLVLMKLWKKDTNPFLVFLAAAMHDSAREDESEDHWDRESGKNMKHIMERIGFNSLPNKEEFLDYARAISRKETVSKKEMSLAAMIVYDADCLEIIRCLSDPSRFVQNRLCINGTLDSKVQSEFIDEVKRFIQMTESLSFKTDFENITQKPLSDLLRFLSAHSEEFPFLNHILSEEIRSI